MTTTEGMAKHNGIQNSAPKKASVHDILRKEVL